MRSWVYLSTRQSRCAARQQCQTAEHDQNKERVIAAAKGLVRHITVFKWNICACLHSMCTHTFFCQWEWVKCIIELIVCNSLSHDENNNTIRPFWTASVLWNRHVFLIYLLLLLGAFSRPTIKNTHQGDLCQQHKCLYPYVIFLQPQYVLLLKLFSQTLLFCSVVSIHTRGLWEFNKIPPRICSYPKFLTQHPWNLRTRVVSILDN